MTQNFHYRLGESGLANKEGNENNYFLSGSQNSFCLHSEIPGSGRPRQRRATLQPQVNTHLWAHRPAAAACSQPR